MKTGLPQVRVRQLELVQRGAVLALADIEIGGAILLRRVRLIQDAPALPSRIQGPQHVTFGQDGTPQYHSCLRFRKPFRPLVLEAVRAEYLRVLKRACDAGELGKSQGGLL